MGANHPSFDAVFEEGQRAAQLARTAADLAGELLNSPGPMGHNRQTAQLAKPKAGQRAAQLAKHDGPPPASCSPRPAGAGELAQLARHDGQPLASCSTRQAGAGERLSAPGAENAVQQRRPTTSAGSACPRPKPGEGTSGSWRT